MNFDEILKSILNLNIVSSSAITINLIFLLSLYLLDKYFRIPIVFAQWPFSVFFIPKSTVGIEVSVKAKLIIILNTFTKLITNII